MASTDESAAQAATTPVALSEIVLRTPSKYASSGSRSATASSALASFTAPPSEWLMRTWSVTHSTLSMWRSAQNVRISYRPLPDDASGRARNEDHVQYESNKPGGTGPRKVKSVQGVNIASVSGTAADNKSDGTFDWRGKGWLFFVTSHWEILGWGERPLAGGQPGEVERWVVTWFAPTFFTKEGIDIYSDKQNGLSAELAGAVQTAMSATAQWPAPLVALAKDLLPVDIHLPWSE